MLKGSLNKLKIGILGTRGIPNNYGGFEQWAENLSQGLLKRGCEIYVYNSHNHTNQEKLWNGVNIIHKYDPEYKIGTVGQFFYDLNCIIDSRKQKFDIILQLGYTSSSIWGWLLPKNKSVVITNMDGLEWKRNKFKKPVKSFLKFAEKLAVYFSNYLIADSPIIKDYYNKNYSIPIDYIPYGTNLFEKENEQHIHSFEIKPYQYNLLIARLEPENTIETIIKGVINSNTSFPLLIVGDYNISNGKYLYNEYSENEKIIFTGRIYNSEILNNLRYFSNLYFHGHSVGGTNPSLLEAMACSAIICAHDNLYNRSVLQDEGYYFSNPKDITLLLDEGISKEIRDQLIRKNIDIIDKDFLMSNIIDQYYELFERVSGVCL